MEYLIIFFDNIHFAFCEAKLQCAKTIYISFIIKYLFLSAKKKTLPKRVINRTYFADFNTQKKPKKPQPEHTIANILSIIYLQC